MRKMGRDVLILVLVLTSFPPSARPCKMESFKVESVPVTSLPFSPIVWVFFLNRLSVVESDLDILISLCSEERFGDTK